MKHRGTGNETFKVMMHRKEANLIIQELKKGKEKKTMLEWGSGGSTLYFSNYVKDICSFEHNIEWYKKISKQIKADGIKNVDYNYVQNDFVYKPKLRGEKKRYKGTPAKYFKTYINAIEKYDKLKFDVILVDGRCRLYCAVKALPHLKDDGHLYIHDFFHRKQYHDVFKFYDMVSGIKNTVQTIVKLKKKPKENMLDSSFSDNVKTIEEIAEVMNRDPNNMEYFDMGQSEALGILVQSANMAQKKGAFSLQEASVIEAAVSTFVAKPEATSKNGNR